MVINGGASPLTELRVLVVALALTAAHAVPVHCQAPSTPETVTVQSGALELRGLLWRPSGPGAFPAVLFNHGSGRTSELRKPDALGELFARRGYVFLFLYRRGAGLSANQGPNSAEVMAKAREQGGQEKRNQVQLQLLETELNDLVAGVAYLRKRSDVDPRRLAIAGHSFGGSLTLLLGERDPELKAALVFGGAAGSWVGSPPLQTRLLAAADHARVPVFFVYAKNDYSTAPGTTLAAEMKKTNKPHLLKIYPAVGHSQADGHDLVYLRPSAWEADVFAFLEKYMSR